MHPTPDLLAAFDAGQLPQTHREAIEKHVADCPECCQALERLPVDDLAALIRTATGGSTPISGEPSRPNDSMASGVPPELLVHPRYQVLGQIGSGGMGVVYRALQLQLDRIVAVKVIHRLLTRKPGFAERFTGEVKALARLNHPNVVAAHDADRAGELHFLVMEYVEGESLETIVRRRGPLPLTEACGIIQQAATGLQHAFENGIVHRDVKPGNLLLMRSGVVKVVDFGLSRMVQDEGEAGESAREIVGTPEYMAPEQCREPDSADTRSDLYSLGCTLYFLLAARPPFMGANPLQTLLAHQDTEPPPIRDFRPDVPPRLTAIIDRLLSKDPSQRFATPAEVAQSLAAVMGSRPNERRRGRWPQVLLIAAVVLLATAVTVVALTFPHDREPEPLRYPDHDLAVSEPTPPQNVFEVAPMPRPGGPDAMATPSQLTDLNREAGERLVAWIRENNVWGKDHKIVWDIAKAVEKHQPRSPTGFLVRLGARMVKSGRPTLMITRYGVSYSFDLTADQALAVGLRDRDSVVSKLPGVWDLVRARPTVELSNLHIENAEGLTRDQPFRGSIAYRFLTPPRAGGYLRMMYYLPDYKQVVMLNHHPKGRIETRGEFSFRFDPLGFSPFRDQQLTVLFAEWVTRNGTEEVVEGPAVATVLRLRFTE